MLRYTTLWWLKGIWKFLKILHWPYFFWRIKAPALDMKFIETSNMWKCFTAWHCVFRKMTIRDASPRVPRRMLPDSAVVWPFLEKNHQHTRPLEGLSQMGRMWHIASKRRALAWPGNGCYFVFGKAEGLLCVSVLYVCLKLNTWMSTHCSQWMHLVFIPSFAKPVIPFDRFSCM